MGFVNKGPEHEKLNSTLRGSNSRAFYAHVRIVTSGCVMQIRQSKHFFASSVLERLKVSRCFLNHPHQRRVTRKMSEEEAGLKDDVVLVTGANSLLGQHVIKHLQLYWDKLDRIKTFDLRKFFTSSLSKEKRAKHCLSSSKSNKGVSVFRTVP